MARGCIDIAIETIHVTPRVRKNYGHLNDLKNALREKNELETPILVSCEPCKRHTCGEYQRTGEARRMPTVPENTDLCRIHLFYNGLCLRLPTLIDGATRLEAARQLEWKMIPCVLIEKRTESWMKETEIITNTLRKPFDLWEKIEAGLILEKREKELATGRINAGVAVDEDKRGRVRDLVAKKAGFASFNSYHAAKTVYLKAEPKIKSHVETGDLSVSAAVIIAGLAPDMQAKIVSVLDILFSSGKSSARIVSRFVHRIIANGLIEPLMKKIEQDQIKKSDELIALIKSFSPDKALFTDEECANHQNLTCHSDICRHLDSVQDSLAEFVMSASKIARMDKESTYTIDKTLLHIEKIARNCRGHLRINTPHFDDTFADLVKYHRSVFIETIQFFSNTLNRKLSELDDTLREDLDRTFHNSITILHRLATNAPHILRD